MTKIMKERIKGQVLIIIPRNYASTIELNNDHQNDKEKDKAHIIIILNDVFIIENNNDHKNWRRIMITMIIIEL